VPGVAEDMSGKDTAAPPVDAGAAFHRAYFASRVHRRTTFAGVPIIKAVTDLWAYQQLIAELRPVVIVELGVWAGGFLVYADWLCRGLGIDAKIIGVDVTDARIDGRALECDRVEFIQASSLAPVVAGAVRDARVDRPGPMLVSVDDDHHADHVHRELEILRPLTQAGDVVVVEDTNVSMVRPTYGPGPAEGLRAYLRAHPRDYRVDRSLEPFGFSFASGGWLRRL